MTNSMIVPSELQDVAIQPLTILGDYYADLFEGELTENTRRAYTRDIKDFFELESLMNIPLDKIRAVTSATANQYIELLRERGKADSTISRKLTSLSCFFTFLSRYEIGLVPYNPFSRGQGAKRIKQSKRYSNTTCLTPEEVSMLIRETMRQDDIESIRNRIIVLLLSTTGMRRDEIASVTIGMIVRSHGKWIMEIIGKGNKARLVVVSNTLKSIIDRYIELRGVSYDDKNEPLLVSHSWNAKYHNSTSKSDGITSQSIYNVIKKIAKQAGLPSERISPHCLRHTFATESLNMNIPVQDVADMLGHADLSTTRRYDHSRRVVSNSPADKLEEMYMSGVNSGL